MLPITNGILNFEGQGMGNSSTQVGDLDVGETKEVAVDLTPSRAGMKHILIDFDTDQIQDIKAFYELDVFY